MLPPRSCGDDVGTSHVAFVVNHRKITERQPRERASRKWGVRCLLLPLLCQGRAPRVQGRPASRRFRSRRLCGKRNRLGHPFRGSSCVARVSGCERRIERVRLRECRWSGPHEGGPPRGFIGERWEAINLPLSWSKAVVQAFLIGWSCTVEASFRAGKTQSATVRSAEPPPHHRLQPDFGIGPRSHAGGPGAVEAGKNHARSCAGVVWGDSKKAAAVLVSVTRPEAAKRSLPNGESVDTTQFGAISWCGTAARRQHRFCSLHDRNRLDALQPPPSPVLADTAAQLQVPTASVQPMATTVGQLGAQKRRGGGHRGSSGQAKVQTCQTCAVLSHSTPGARRGTRLVTAISVALEPIWWSTCLVARALRPATPSRYRRGRLRAVAARRAWAR